MPPSVCSRSGAAWLTHGQFESIIIKSIASDHLLVTPWPHSYTKESWWPLDVVRLAGPHGQNWLFHKYISKNLPHIDPPLFIDKIQFQMISPNVSNFSFIFRTAWPFFRENKKMSDLRWPGQLTILLSVYWHTRLPRFIFCIMRRRQVSCCPAMAGRKQYITHPHGSYYLLERGRLSGKPESYIGDM